MLDKIVKTIIGRWQVALGVLGLLVLTHGLAYCVGRSDGRELVIAKLEKAEAEAVRESAKARASADANAQAREAEAKVEQEALQKVIEDAKANDDNPLDAVFGSMQDD